MKEAKIGITKLNMRFNNEQGQEVNFDYIEIEVAPNLYAKINLTPSNVRVLQKYNPDFYQLITNIPLGSELVFAEYHEKHLDGIYSADPNNNML